MTLIGQRSRLVFGARKMASSADAVTGQMDKMEVSGKEAAKPLKSGKKKGSEAAGDGHSLEVWGLLLVVLTVPS